MIEIRKVTKSFSKLKVLDKVSLKIQEGEIFGIVGHSGTGKSTLLRCLNGLENYDSGYINIMGKEVGELSIRQLRIFRKDLGMIFQSFNLLNRLNVYENIALPLKLWGYSKVEIKNRVSTLLNMVGIEEKALSYPKELSGGQKQRVAIARALAEKKLNLDYTVKVHIEPMGVYSKKLKNIKSLKAGATIAVPNDPTNEARALRVLESAGLFKLKAGDLVTPIDITENPNKYKIKELEAAQLPRTLDDVDAAVVNTNYALEAKLSPTKDALVLEDKSSPYANVLAVRKEDKDKPYIKALSEALNSIEVKKFIEDNYKGSIIPAF